MIFTDHPRGCFRPSNSFTTASGPERRGGAFGRKGLRRESTADRFTPCSSRNRDYATSWPGQDPVDRARRMMQACNTRPQPRDDALKPLPTLDRQRSQMIRLIRFVTVSPQSPVRHTSFILSTTNISAGQALSRLHLGIHPPHVHTHTFPALFTAHLGRGLVTAKLRFPAVPGFHQTTSPSTSRPVPFLRTPTTSSTKILGITLGYACSLTYPDFYPRILDAPSLQWPTRCFPTSPPNLTTTQPPGPTTPSNLRSRPTTKMKVPTTLAIFLLGSFGLQDLNSTYHSRHLTW